MISKFQKRLMQVSKPRFRVNFFEGKSYLVPANATADILYENAPIDFKKQNDAIMIDRGFYEVKRIFSL